MNHESVLLSQREAYGLALADLGEDFPKMVVIDADVSKSTRTVYFGAKYPERFFNFGIAEQNMMAAAAGMAVCGWMPVVNSFSFLTTFRAADQFQTSIVYPKLNVKVVANYGGLSDSYDGPTHQTVSDIAWVRALPNLCVVVPADAVEVQKALPVILQYEGPVWLRLCRAEMPVLHDSSFEFQLGKAETLRRGEDVTIVSCGVVLSRVLEAVSELIEAGVNPTVISVATLKPFDTATIIEAARLTGAILTCEEHNIVGGLGSAVCETTAQSCPVPVVRLGVPDTFAESGGFGELLDKYGLSVAGIVSAALKLVQTKKTG